MITSKGQDKNPATAAAIAPLTEAAGVELRLKKFCYLNFSNKGSWIAENSISLTKVVCNPV